MVIEIDTLADFPTSDTEEDGAAAVAACGAVRFQSKGCLLRIGCFDEYELVSPDFVEDAHALPHADDGFHVKIRGKEDDEAVGCDFGKFCQQGAVVADDTWLVADLEAGGHGGLVGAAGDDHGEERVPGKRHTVGFLNDGGEAKHFGIHL